MRENIKIYRLNGKIVKVEAKDSTIGEIRRRYNLGVLMDENRRIVEDSLSLLKLASRNLYETVSVVGGQKS